MKENFKLWILNLLGLGMAKPAWAIAAIIIFFVLLAGIAGWISSCRSEEARRKDEERKTAINGANSNIRALEEKGKGAEKDAEDAKKESDDAQSNFNNTTRRDSGDANGDFSAAKRKFCAEFPGDSKCR